MVHIHTPEPKNPRHGYMSYPKSRAVVCRDQQMGGAIQWEPQSVEAAKGFPTYGPPDGQLASGGHARFGVLDGVRDPKGDPWWANPIRAGAIVQWDWWLTASHETTGFSYFVTRDGWDQTTPLTRAHFEPVPFLTVEWTGAKPVQAVSHWGRTPDKTGRHVIYGVWTIADTPMAFYQAIDVEISA